MRKKLKFKKDIAFYVFQIIRYPLKLFMYLKLKLNLIENEAKNDNGPFFIIGNHVTSYDPLISLVYLKPLVKFVAADTNYDSHFKKAVFNFAGVIPIAKKNQDILTIKRLIREVKKNNAVGLYPEGGRNWDGETDELIYSTVKLIKLLKIKVYVQILKGAYMSSPRWGKTIRKGKTNVYITKILEKEQIIEMSEDEIFEVMKKSLNHNDYEFQIKNMISLKGRDNAEYIERLIYVCPICYSINSFKSKGDYFNCKECNSAGKVNKYGFIEGDFKYDNLVDWNKFQKSYLEEYLTNNSIKPIVINNVKYIRSIKNEKKKSYMVDFIIDNDKMTIHFTDKSKKIIEYSQIKEPSITLKKLLIFYEKNIRHEFVIQPFLHNNTSIVYIEKVISFLRGKNHGCRLE